MRNTNNSRKILDAKDSEILSIVKLKNLEAEILNYTY